jgi:hypothetical protein
VDGGGGLAVAGGGGLVVGGGGLLVAGGGGLLVVGGGGLELPPPPPPPVGLRYQGTSPTASWMNLTFCHWIWTPPHKDVRKGVKGGRGWVLCRAMEQHGEQ